MNFGIRYFQNSGLSSYLPAADSVADGAVSVGQGVPVGSACSAATWRQQAAIPTKTNKQTHWPLVRERTIPTDRQPLVDEI
jgi:hypothetical protein